MAVASLPSTYAKFPLRILNKGPEFFRDQVVHERGHSSSQKSAAERLAETRTQYVKSYNKESDSQEKVAVPHKGVSKETTQESVPKQHSSPKKRGRNEHKLKLQTTTPEPVAETASDINDSKPVAEELPKKSDATVLDESRQTSEFEEEMKGVGKLINRYQNDKSPVNQDNQFNKLPQFSGKKSRSPPQIPKKPKRCTSPGNRSCDDSDEMPFKRISVKQAAKSWENVSGGMLENYRMQVGVRKHRSGDAIDSSQRSPEGNGVKLKTSNIAKAWEKLAADIDREENGKRGNPPPKVKLIDDAEKESNSYHQPTKKSAVKVKLTESSTISHTVSKPLKVQLINSYNTEKSQENEGNQTSQAPPIRATVKVVDTNMNDVSGGGGNVYERKDPKRAIRAKVEQVDDFAMGKVSNYSNHVTRHSERPKVQSQVSNQSEATTDSNLSAKVRLLLVQSKENLANTENNTNTTLNNVTNNESPTRGRAKCRKMVEKTKNAEGAKENNYRANKRSPQHHGRSKSSGPLYRMHLGSSQDSGQTHSYDSTKNTTDTSSPARSSSPCLGSPRGSRIRRLQEQLLALCDTEDSSSFDSPDSLGDGRFVRSRSSRSYTKEDANEDWGLPRRGSAPARHKGKEREHSPKKEKKASAKENVIVERRDMPVPTVCTTKKTVPERSKGKKSTDAGKKTSAHVQRKDTRSSFDSTDAKLASSEATNELKDVFEKQNTELVIIERPGDLITSPVSRKSLSPVDRSNVDSPSSSVKEKYSRMTTIMLGSDDKTGAIDNLPISVDVEVEYDDAFEQEDETNKQGGYDRRQHDIVKAEPKHHDRHHRTEHIKRSSRKHTQTSTDSEDIPSAFATVSRDKSAHMHQTPHADTAGHSKHQRKSARESRKKLFVYEDIDPQQSADQIKSCHSPNMNNNRAAEGFQRGSQMRRSCSDLDPPYLHKAHSELDRFFDQMGLDESVLKRIDAHSGATEDDAFHPMHEMKYYDSDSMYSNDSDNLSQGSKVSDDGLLRRHLTSRLPDQSTSIVMRNARVIKWLCQCRKARTQSVS